MRLLSRFQRITWFSSKYNTAVRASQVKVGDRLGNRKVTDIISVERHGAYAPFTMSGDIVVSGVRASNYVAVLTHSAVNQSGASHAFLALRRLVCTFNLGYCEKETYTNGITFPS
jgi:Hint module